jgi:hypothetical protein
MPMAPAGEGMVDAAPSAPIAAEGAAPAIPAELVRVRVISSSHGHQIDAIVSLAADELEGAVAAGWADLNPVAIAEAERLNDLREVHKDLDKRLAL